MQKLKRSLNQRPESRTLTELVCVLTLNFTARSLHDNSLFLKWGKQSIKVKKHKEKRWKDRHAEQRKGMGLESEEYPQDKKFKLKKRV